MTVRLDRDGQAAGAGEADHGRDVGGVGRLGHGGNGVLDGPVPGTPGLVEPVVP
ncbi:hypothetical protein GCM10009733_097400 [Nonomuraea maheshkhaliensis]|uniref:Uncharacterized protein n=1 Tax=Nonomuraea maheshkhaliensis TaxID=419590 RepID=A0ABP4TBC3_9ACTN